MVQNELICNKDGLLVSSINRRYMAGEVIETCADFERESMLKNNFAVLADPEDENLELSGLDNSIPDIYLIGGEKIPGLQEKLTVPDESGLLIKTVADETPKAKDNTKDDKPVKAKVAIAHVCPGCGRSFKSKQGVAAHKRACKGKLGSNIRG